MICPECNGRGEVKYYREVNRDAHSVTVEGYLDICHTCHGSGIKVQSNADHIRSMTDEELAKRNVRKIKTPVTGCYDYGESYTDYYDAWETSDGAIFWTEKPAVEYELNWLKQPYKEDA